MVLPALPLIVSAVTEESIYYPAAANVLEGSYGGGGLLNLRSVNGEYYSVVSGSVHWTATAYHPITYSLLGGTLHISGFPSDTASDDNRYLVSIAAKSLIPKQYYASAYNLLGGTSLVSGGIHNTTSDDGSYMIVRSYGTQTALSTYYTSAIRLLGSTGTVGDTAELRNDASWSSTAKSGSSIYFDGDDYLAVPSSSTFRSPRITFAAWIRTAGKTGQQHIIDCRDAYGGWNLRLDGSSYPLDLIWIVKDSNGVEHGEYIPGVIHNNTWYYVAGTYDGAYKKIYLNGQQIGSWYLGSLDTTQTYCEVHIGAFAGGSGYGFKGWIDEVVIYSEALDSSALQSNMNGNIVYSNLKAYWTFDENSGGKAYSWHLKNRINDDDSQYMLFSSYSTIRATSENTGTIMGSVTWTNGMHSGGLYLSGLSSMIEVPNHASLNPQQITVALWFKPMGKTGEQHLVDKRGSIGGFDLRIDGSTYPLDIIWILRNGTDEVGRALFGRIYNNTWTFIAATYDGQYMRIYNNTGLIGEWNIGYVDITGSTSPLHIGSFAYGNGYNFKGVVDNVAIYSRALSWTELASLRDNNPPSSGLIALWRLDEMQGSYAHSECEAYVSEVEFSGSSNTYVWEKLTFRVDSAWVPTSVNVTIQAYNYTDGKYPTSGIGYLSYVGGEAEEKSLIIQQNPMHFRSENGEWKIKITGWKLREPFTFKLDMLKCETSYYTKFAAEVEFTGEGDSYYWDYLNATFNLAWDAGEVSVQLYLWNYSASAYQLLASAVS
ncbi:MAG: LamG domain-containing protein, partial [Candidatus Bathyarchaeia archaeon]